MTADDEERGGVAERDEPERAGGHGLARREVARLLHARGRAAVGAQAVRLRRVAHQLRQRQRDEEHEDARGQGRPAPAEAGERERDERGEQPADRHPHAADAQRQRAAPAEPGDERHADRQVAAKARAQRHHEERREERHRPVDAREEHEADAEHAHADADERARTEAVREPALDGAEDAALRARHGEGRRHQRLAPAELLAQQHGVGTVRVEHERADQELEAEAGGNHPPAVEDGHARF